MGWPTSLSWIADQTMRFFGLDLTNTAVAARSQRPSGRGRMKLCQYSQDPERPTGNSAHSMKSWGFSVEQGLSCEKRTPMLLIPRRLLEELRISLTSGWPSMLVRRPSPLLGLWYLFAGQCIDCWLCTCDRPWQSFLGLMSPTFGALVA